MINGRLRVKLKKKSVKSEVRFGNFDKNKLRKQNFIRPAKLKILAINKISVISNDHFWPNDKK